MPRYNTFDVSREKIYFSEYMAKKLAMNSEYNKKNKPPADQIQEWEDEWTDEKQWMKAKRHLNRSIQFSYPFCNVKSPEFRSWFHI